MTTTGVLLGQASPIAACLRQATEKTRSLAQGRAGNGGNSYEGGNGGTGTGIANSGSLNPGDGKDTITGTGSGGNSGGGLDASNGGDGIGIANSSKLDTGGGKDTIIGIGTGGNRGNGGTGTGIQNTKDATITTGWGNDTITGYGNSSGTNSTAYGIVNDGIIDIGNGSDKLTGQATATIGGTAYGIYGKGIIKTGDDDDEIIATSILDGVQQKVSIGGGISIDLGTGDDYFKGFGVATVDGGDGFDTLDLRAFNRSQLLVSGVISGNTLKSANITFNNNENPISFSTTGFEKFIFADSSFCYSTLANSV
ncbi:hypothetical protein [Nostoc favosum]|uniref:Uncharacterized protein n=1 Tax=Nostoc favosum CHAB5714 TaxID=2780399 RepID=A0ABS8I267_9NOSO|nr:hypothetical protein [Nostoc favosum]MCC5598157.1 hypothetical protein [Nostoc favosum CHAB5714]